MKVKLKTENSYVLKLSQEEIERLWYLSYCNESGPIYPAEGRLHTYIPADVSASAQRRFQGDD